MKPDPPLRAIDLTKPPLLFTLRQLVLQLDYMKNRCVFRQYFMTRGKTEREFKRYTDSWAIIFMTNKKGICIQVNLDMTDSMGPGKLVHHMQNPSYTYDEYLICIGLGPSISSVICKNPLYSGPSYPSSPVLLFPVILLSGKKPRKLNLLLLSTNTTKRKPCVHSFNC